MSKRTAMFCIGVQKFATKCAAEQRVRQILESHADMQRLSGDDDAFVRALIDLHPNREKVIDCGIDYIFVQYLDTGARRFVAVHRDRSWRDFSWRHAIYPRAAITRLRSVLRGLIRDQILRHRDRHFHERCENPLCAAPILQPEDCHVDHMAPATFQDLVDGWLRLVRLNAEDIGIQASSQYEFYSRLEDSALEQSWQEFHAINARLRCLCRQCNLSVFKISARKFTHHGAS